MGLAEQHAASIDDPEGFWGQAAAAIDWVTPPSEVLKDGQPSGRWFVGGELNTAYNALDRHVAAGRGDELALVYDSPVTDTVRRLTFSELRDEVAMFAGALARLGVGRGDRVVIYMPMVPETVVAMLACARLGAIHSVVFGGFAARELAVRVDDAEPKVVVSASCGIEGARVVEYKPLLDRALDLAEHRVDACVILQRPECAAELTAGRDIDWTDAITGATPADCVPVKATDPLYILYTSGTTGRPKGVVRDNGGHAVALRWSMEAVYDTRPGDVFWAASDVGWVVGHSYIVYAPLITGCTTVLYEGKPVGTPDAGAFWRVISEHGVTSLFTAPTAFRAIRKEDPQGDHLRRWDMSRFRALFLAGERLDTDTYDWASRTLGVPVIDHWWQTETGWPIVATPLGMDAPPVKPGSPGHPVPGWDVRVLRESGEPADPLETGAIALRLPLPPGALPTLWNDEERFVESYLSAFPGYYVTGDGGHVDGDGYVFVMGRLDDVINVAGHRLSTGAMEEVVGQHPSVAECAVVGVAHGIKGQVPHGFVVTGGQEGDAEELRADLAALVREQIGPVASFNDVTVVPRLPKTRSGKILRATLRSIADGQEYQVPSTIDDPAILDEIADRLGPRERQ